MAGCRSRAPSRRSHDCLAQHFLQQSYIFYDEERSCWVCALCEQMCLAAQSAGIPANFLHAADCPHVLAPQAEAEQSRDAGLFTSHLDTLPQDEREALLAAVYEWMCTQHSTITPLHNCTYDVQRNYWLVEFYSMPRYVVEVARWHGAAPVYHVVSYHMRYEPWPSF